MSFRPQGISCRIGFNDINIFVSISKTVCSAYHNKSSVRSLLNRISKIPIGAAIGFGPERIAILIGTYQIRIVSTKAKAVGISANHKAGIACDIKRVAAVNIIATKNFLPLYISKAVNFEEIYICCARTKAAGRAGYHVAAIPGLLYATPLIAAVSTIRALKFYLC